MKHLRIRQAKLSDLKIIQDLSQGLMDHDAQWDRFFNLNWSHDKNGERFFRKILTNRKCVCWVAEINKTAVGYLAASVLPINSWRPLKRTEITNLFVKGKFRGMDIGTKLVENFLRWSKEKGVKRAVVVANASNTRALTFYKKKSLMPVFVTLEADI